MKQIKIHATIISILFVLQVSTAQNIGIGTTTAPAARLEIKRSGTTSATTTLQVNKDFVQPQFTLL